LPPGPAGDAVVTIAQEAQRIEKAKLK